MVLFKNMFFVAKNKAYFWAFSNKHSFACGLLIVNKMFNLLLL